jgi:hypothetical protein
MTPVIFFAILDLEQKALFLDRHSLNHQQTIASSFEGT